MKSILTGVRIANSGNGRGTGEIDALVEVTQSKRVTKASSKHSSSKPRVLLVDDDYHLLNVFALWLGTEGLEVMTAVDGVQALTVAEHTRPDLVVADVVMPRMDGVRLAREMSERRIPIILISANTVPPMIDQDIPFISKPFDLMELSSLITRLLGRGPEAPARNN